ncbi:MAG: P-loop NTPase [Haloarculaceae archaeon]
MLAVAGGKGGTGKTTTALGLAEALARRGAAPFVADADRTMPNLHHLAETPRAPGTGALAAGRSLDEAAHPSPALPGVRVLPTDPDTDAGTLRRGLRALAANAGLGPTASPVLVDCPAGAGRDAALALASADRTLLVATPRRAAVRAARKTAAMARALDAPPVGCVLTRTERPPPDVARALDCPVLACVPAVDGPLAAPDARRAFDRLERGVRNARNV